MIFEEDGKRCAAYLVSQSQSMANSQANERVRFNAVHSSNP
jgi:hypothetical protein